MELLREEFTLLQRECLACGRAGASYLLLQPADEHDLSGIEEEAKQLAAFEDRGQLSGHGLLVAVRVNDWSLELSLGGASALGQRPLRRRRARLFGKATRADSGTETTL